MTQRLLVYSPCRPLSLQAKDEFLFKEYCKKWGQSTLGQDWEELESEMYYMVI